MLPANDPKYKHIPEAAKIKTESLKVYIFVFIYVYMIIIFYICVRSMYTLLVCVEKCMCCRKYLLSN